MLTFAGTIKYVAASGLFGTLTPTTPQLNAEDHQ
jgi:hypothetical protein